VGGTPSTQKSTGISSLDKIIGVDDSLRNSLGLSPDSPVPTPAVTREGVPLQTLDFIGGRYSLSIEDETGSDATSEAAIEDMVNRGSWLPTKEEDFRSLTLGDRQSFVASFGEILQSLSLMPVESVKTLNIIAHAGPSSLIFKFDYLFNQATGELIGTPGTILDPLQQVAFPALVNLASASLPIEVGPLKVDLTDVRKAFPVDGEVRLFNIDSTLSAEYVQAMANLFKVRTTGFVSKHVKVTAEVIAVTEPASERVLSKKVTVGRSIDPVSKSVPFFENLLAEDRGFTGAFTAFPRR
jgi:hypothetical protein